MVIFRKIILVLVCAFSIVLMSVSETDAQCAMCTLNAENSTKEGNMQGKGLNNGILFLLSMPFLIGAGVGFLWYKKFRVTSDKETHSSSL